MPSERLMEISDDDSNRIPTNEMQRYAAATTPYIYIKLNARELLDGDAGKRKFLGAAVRCTGEYMTACCLSSAARMILWAHCFAAE